MRGEELEVFECLPALRRGSVLRGPPVTDRFFLIRPDTPQLLLLQGIDRGLKIFLLLLFEGVDGEL